MTPFCCSNKGGSHEKYRVRGVVALVEKFRGEPDGAGSNQGRKIINMLELIE